MDSYIPRQDKHGYSMAIQTNYYGSIGPIKLDPLPWARVWCLMTGFPHVIRAIGAVG